MGFWFAFRFGSTPCIKSLRISDKKLNVCCSLLAVLGEALDKIPGPIIWTLSQTARYRCDDFVSLMRALCRVAYVHGRHHS